MPVNDLTGKRFGRLLVIDRATAPPSKGAHWNCVCQCGATRVVRGNNLTGGYVVSCGCARIKPERPQSRFRERAATDITPDAPPPTFTSDALATALGYRSTHA